MSGEVFRQEPSGPGLKPVPGNNPDPNLINDAPKQAMNSGYGPNNQEVPFVFGFETAQVIFEATERLKYDIEQRLNAIAGPAASGWPRVVCSTNWHGNTAELQEHQVALGPNRPGVADAGADNASGSVEVTNQVYKSALKFEQTLHVSFLVNNHGDPSQSINMPAAASASERDNSATREQEPQQKQDEGQASLEAQTSAPPQTQGQSSSQAAGATQGAMEIDSVTDATAEAPAPMAKRRLVTLRRIVCLTAARKRSCQLAHIGPALPDDANSEVGGLAGAGTWVVMVPKHRFAEGQLVLYFAIDSFLPAKDHRFWEVTGNGVANEVNKGERGFRVKTFVDRFSGDMSQGLIFSIQHFLEVTHRYYMMVTRDFQGDEPAALRALEAQGHSWETVLGVRKWQPEWEDMEMPDGRVISMGRVPSFIRPPGWSRVQDYSRSDLFGYLKGKDDTRIWQVTEKLDGVTMTIYRVALGSRWYDELPSIADMDAAAEHWARQYFGKEADNEKNSKEATRAPEPGSGSIASTATGTNNSGGGDDAKTGNVSNMIATLKERIRSMEAGGKYRIGVTSWTDDYMDTGAGNVFWRVAREQGLLERLCEPLAGMPENVAIFGELCGSGVEGSHNLKLAEDEYRFLVFSMFDLDKNRFVPPWRGVVLCQQALRAQHVPVLGYFRLSVFAPGGMAELLRKAEGEDRYGQEREGLVFKREDGADYFKVISNRWLIKTGK